MARPSIYELCGLDTSTLVGVDHETASKTIIDALIEERGKTAHRLMALYAKSTCDYEGVCFENSKLIYLDRAIEARKKDLEEMSISYSYTQRTQNGQSRKQSHYEVIANMIAGIIIGWCLVYFAFPLMGIDPTPEQATISSGMFFVASYIRSYSIRRVFNKIHIKG